MEVGATDKSNSSGGKNSSIKRAFDGKKAGDPRVKSHGSGTKQTEPLSEREGRKCLKKIGALSPGQEERQLTGPRATLGRGRQNTVAKRGMEVLPGPERVHRKQMKLWYVKEGAPGRPLWKISAPDRD